MSDISISAAIVTYNNIDKIASTVESLINFTEKYTVSLTVYDNGSVDGTAEALEKISEINLVRTGGNLGFGKAHNLALKNSMGKYHAIVNPDIRIDTDALGMLVDYLEQNPDVAVVTPKILNPDGTVQHLPKRRPNFKYQVLGRFAKLGGVFKKIRDEYTDAFISQTEEKDIGFCTGCFFVIRSDVFKRLGGFDENFFMYMEDADLTRRAEAFGRVVYYPKAYAYHFWERSSAKKLKFLLIHLKSSLYYFTKWRKERKK